VTAERKTILVVDDEPFFREEVVTFLNSPSFVAHGWTAEAAEDGEEALSKLVQSPWDVILLDINMPKMDGMAVLGAMREKHLLDQTYVIMLSAYGVYENVVASMRGGAKDFVNKSEPLEQWVMRIERGFEWQKLRRHSQQIQEELRMLAREVGHDIGGTTYFVLTQRVEALSKLVAGDQDGERSIEVIEQILGRIKRLADDLGQVAVALDSSEVWRWEPLNLQYMLERLIQEFSFGNPDVTIVREWDETVPPIQGSRAQLERVFYNLLSNAGEAMPDGGTLTLRTQQEGDSAVVDVEDTGVGIPPETKGKIFRIGYSEWKSGHKGSGLGLYIARRNVENHGGRIEVNSTVGRGTTVTTHLPIDSKDTGSNAAKSAIIDL
jgi:two-component system sensor histidine kinase/response regulator